MCFLHLNSAKNTNWYKLMLNIEMNNWKKFTTPLLQNIVKVNSGI